jgi:hypothetical protein
MVEKTPSVAILFLALVPLVALSAPAERPPDPAGKLFSTFQQCVFQIRVIDNTSGKKSTIGSGFSVSSRGLFATNYHVVAELVQEPKRFRLEYVASSGRTGPLRLLDIDVVHDLAVVASDSADVPFFSLNNAGLLKGTRIFSMGNPLDLGMTIIEGTYSGFIEESLYEKILFSGSLNPGMSGGPALDASGAVIGVNVSTAGNEISFLVPAKYLQTLLDTVGRRGGRGAGDFTKRIEEELYENQRQYMSRLLSTEWKQDTLGHCLVPREMGSVFKCWGETPHDSEVLYTVSSVYCANSDDIYLSSELTTGSIEFNYHWFETARLGSERFFRVLQGRFSETGVPNFGAKKELDEPRCNTRFVRTAGSLWKTTLCSWRYKKYPRLHDVSLKMALVNRKSQSMVIDLALRGVSRESAISFCKKFMEALQWRN